MKTTLKAIFIILMAVMLITVFTTSAKAEYSAEVTMTPDKTEVNPGDTVTVVVNLVNVVDAGTGASEMAGNVEYDTNFIESISSTQGTWMTNPETGMFLLSGNILTEDGQFAVLQFKISENATGSSSVTFTELITADGSGVEPSSPDITLTFTVANTEEPGGDDNTTGNDNTTGDDNTVGDDNTTGDDNTAGGNNTAGGGNTNTNRNSIRGNSTSNVTAPTRLPNAGIGTGIFIAAVVLVAVIIGSYVLYKRYQKI